ncbi:MAG: hypothetical protein MSJ26_02840 [Oscillospiraceae bacterium]|nr:hypothetical protein [Oscillospiraceae bacterium]
MLSTECIILSAKEEKLIKCGTAEDFSRLLPDIIDNSNLFHNYTPYDYTSSLLISSVEFICTYASRFPKSFSREEFSEYFQIVLVCAALRKMTASDPADILLLKKMDLSWLSPYEYNELILTAAINDRRDCLELLLKSMSSSNQISVLPNKVLYYLYDNGLNDIIDMFMKNYSKEIIISVFKYSNDINNSIEFDYTCKRTVTECFYDTCVSFIPDIRNAENKSLAVSEFMEEADFSFLYQTLSQRDFSFSASQLNELSAMERLGLRMSNISVLVSYLAEVFRNSDEENLTKIIDQYIKPILSEKLTLRLFSLTDPISFYTIHDLPPKKLIFLLNSLGKERISFDMTSKALSAQSDSIDMVSENMERCRSLFRRLINSGIGFILDEDMSCGCAAEVITDFPILLETMLDRRVFSTAQFGELIAAAVRSKRVESLNILNKYSLSGGYGIHDALKGGHRNG